MVAFGFAEHCHFLAVNAHFDVRGWIASDTSVDGSRVQPIWPKRYCIFRMAESKCFGYAIAIVIWCAVRRVPVVGLAEALVPCLSVVGFTDINGCRLQPRLDDRHHSDLVICWRLLNEAIGRGTRDQDDCIHGPRAFNWF